MKYTNFKYNGINKIGVLVDDKVADIQRCYALYLKNEKKDPQPDEMANIVIPNNFDDFLKLGEYSWNESRKAYDYSLKLDKNILGINGEFLFYDFQNIEIKSPINPETIMCPGPEIKKENYNDMKQYNEFFLKARDTVVNPDTLIEIDKSVGRINFQPELGLVFGGCKRNLTEDNIEENIFGYTILNNIYSIDRLQVGWEGTMFHVRYGEGASFDNSAPIGPWVVTKDEIENPENLVMKKYLNDELIEQSNTNDLQRSVKEFASYCSIYFPMQPSIFVSTGNANGPKLTIDENKRPIVEHDETITLKDNDQITCEIVGLGKIKNTIKMVRG